MSIPTASLVVALLVGYAWIGLVFTAWFLVAGIRRLDEVAASGTIGFRILLVPGSIALWPILLSKSIRNARTQREKGVA